MAQLELVAYLVVSSSNFTNVMKKFQFYLYLSHSQSQDTPNPIALVKISILLFWSVVEIFVFCETSERLTIEFDEIDFYNEWDWYLFPNEVRRILPTIIINVQEPVALQGYGNITCTRETFKRVIFCDSRTNIGYSDFFEWINTVKSFEFISKPICNFWFGISFWVRFRWRIADSHISWYSGNLDKLQKRLTTYYPQSQLISYT